MTAQEFYRLRPWMIAIIVGLLANAAGGIWWAAVMTSRVADLSEFRTGVEKRAEVARIDRARLGELAAVGQSKFENLDATLNRMDRRLDSIDQKLGRTAAR